MTKQNTIISRYLKLYTDSLLVPVLIATMAFYGLLLFGTGIFYSPIHSHQAETSTEYRYNDSFNNTLTKYTVLNELYQDELSFATPGLVSTNILGSSTKNMVPQGICKAGDYLLISAYDSATISMRTLFTNTKQNSVLYILSSRGEYLNTLVLPDANHVGGITYDGENIWVAKGSDMSCSVIPYEAIELAASGEAGGMQLERYIDDVYCGRNASFIDYYNGKLWIGTFTKSPISSSSVGIYEIYPDQGSYALEEVDSLKLPARAQGLSFFEQDDAHYMIVSTSYGRQNNSTYYLYEIGRYRREYFLNKLGECELPPMSEELYNDGEYSYLMFESAATKYSTRAYYKCKDPVDRICVVENSSLLACMLPLADASQGLD